MENEIRNIRLLRLTLDNFKCHRHLEFAPNGRSAAIYGDNATGKTSIYDGLTWLLFGKDSAGNGEKNIEIKPLDSGGAVADHNAVTCVEAELSDGAATTTLRRTYREVWSSKRGSSEAAYDGNTSEYFVDGVPCKKYVFDAKIQELVPENIFRLLTSVGYFPGEMKWQERRALLSDMAGSLTDREIMAMESRFAPLLEGCGKLSLTDYRQKLAAEKRGLMGTQNQNPARLDECRKTVSDLEELDFDGARARLSILERREQDISGQLLELEHDAAADGKRLEIRSAELERQKLEQENQAYRARQTIAGPDVSALHRQSRSLNALLESDRRQLASAEHRIADCDQKIASSRERWMGVSKETFAGGVCPTCGQKLPPEQAREAEDAFQAHKRGRLLEIQEEADRYKAEKQETRNRRESLEAEVSALEAEIGDLEKQIQAAEDAAVTPSDMEGYAETARAMDSRIQALRQELEDRSAGSRRIQDALRRELTQVQGEIREKREILGKESALTYSRRRIAELEEEGRQTARALENVEKLLYLAEEFTRYKTRFVEDGVNSLFRLARFRLFREQANGGVEERCDVVYDGVPYGMYVYMCKPGTYNTKMATICEQNVTGLITNNNGTFSWGGIPSGSSPQYSVVTLALF